MSDQQAKPAENDKAKAAAPQEDDEDDGYSYTKCCRGYGECIVAVVKCIYNTCVAIKNGICCCCAAWWYPLKERCCGCCDSCDKKMNPYKDPYFNEYETI